MCIFGPQKGAAIDAMTQSAMARYVAALFGLYLALLLALEEGVGRMAQGEAQP